MEQIDMIRCREVARLLNTEQLDDHRFWKRLQVRLHLFMCRHCRRFARQGLEMRLAVRRLLGATNAERPSGDLEKGILRKLCGE